MPIKLSLVTSEGSDYPYKLLKSWVTAGDTLDDTNLSKTVLEANTETSCTVVKYFADATALDNWRTTNETVISSINVKKEANSLSVARTEETVDTIP